MREIYLKTSDNIDIAINHYAGIGNEVLIIAPGWCMTKDSKVFLQIADTFAKMLDVICFDFRGHGKSRGCFTFTAREDLDLKIVVEYAQKHYKKIYILGFSLGAATSLIYSSKNSNVNKIIAVSPPCDFSKIENKIWKKEAWFQSIKKFELKRFLSIRPYLLPLKKIKPIQIITQINIPILFIAGGKDPTVCAWHTQKLYEKVAKNSLYKFYPKGYHAEDLFLFFRDDFVETCLKWLLEDKKSKTNILN